MHTAATRTTTTTTTRPLVVLAGWLGCQPRSLRRYEILYQSLGWQTLTVVASPIAAVNSTLRMYDSNKNDGRVNNTIDPSNFRNWDKHYDNTDENDIPTMEDWSWKVLKDIEGRNPEQFIIHAFSNGGCFLLESICRILDDAVVLVGSKSSSSSSSLANCNTYNSSSQNSITVDKKQQQQQEGSDGTTRKYGLKFSTAKEMSNCHDDTDQGRKQRQRRLIQLASKFSGAVFDSCPAWFAAEPFKLWISIETGTTPTQRQVIEQRFGNRIKVLNDDVKQRNQQYFEYLSESMSSNILSWVPQLYLYSQDDPLTDYKRVQSLIHKKKHCRQRRTRIPSSSSIILDHCWTKSIHCGHLKEHPEEYKSMIVKFLNVGIKNNQNVQSKL